MLNFSGSTLSTFPQGTYLSKHSQYDQCGSLRKTWDARDTSLTNPLQLDYSSAYHHAYLTSMTTPDPDGGGPLVPLTSSTEYDLSTGLVTATTDANSQSTTFDYTDPLNRLKQTVRAASDSSAKNQTTYNYDDVARTVTTTSDLNGYNDNILKIVRIYDGLGRLQEMQRHEGGGSYISMQQQYDAFGRILKTSNPFRPTQGDPLLWTTSTFDGLGRPSLLTSPDNAVISQTYVGNTVTTTDQAGKQRKNVSNSLGQIKEVIEAPNDPTFQYLTTYEYDAFGNLTHVTQGSQHRYFMYDSFTRLIRSRNPEQSTNSSLNLSDPVTLNNAWSSGYNYDANGNMTQKTDARGVIATSGYDALNRNTSVSYSNDPSGTLPVTSEYDLAVNGKGRLHKRQTTGASGSLMTIDSYDAMGRPLTQRQQFFVNGAWSQSYNVQRTYNRAGNVVSQTYPSGHVVTYGFDNAGRLITSGGTLGNGTPRTYSDEILYSPFGGLAKEKFGTNAAIYNKLFYNNRGQLAEIRESTTYTGPNDTSADRGAIVNHFSDQCAGMCTPTSSMTDNNGNLRKQDVLIPNQPTRRQEYDYDPLNRINWAREILSDVEQWKQQFSYDRWGNRTINTSVTYGVNEKDFTINTANNRLGVPGWQAGVMSYDNAGNLITDTYTGAGNRTYDAENRIVSAWGGNNQAQLYGYDASGQRIKRTVNGVETWHVYGFVGELLAEYPANGAVENPQKEYGYRNGQLLVTAEAGGGGDGGTQNVNWANAVGVSISGNSLTRTMAGDGWNAGASSSQMITSGDGYAEFTATETNKKRSVGLTQNMSVTNYQHIAFGMILGDDCQITIHEGFGVYGTFGTYSSGDKLRVAIEGAVVKYRKNGTLLRTSTLAPTYPLYAGASLYSNGGTVTNAILSVGAGNSAAAQLNWLVSDHLGTPRMIFDQTGELENMKRHDYLPFGEELFAPTGGRSAAQGYSGGDGVRQQFTGQQRDMETDLDYFNARYYSSTQGRFTSPDPFGGSGFVTVPQSWNKYAYVLNRPFVFIDPTGEIWLTKDDKTYIWIEDAEYEKNKDKYKGYSIANGAIIQYRGSSMCPQCKDIPLGQYVRLDESGDVVPVEDPTSNIYAAYDELTTMAPTLPGTVRQKNEDTHGPKKGMKEFRYGGSRTERWYDDNGRAWVDIDYGHEHGAGDPHVHWWDWSGAKPQRSDGEPIPAGWEQMVWDNGEPTVNPHKRKQNPAPFTIPIAPVDGPTTMPVRPGVPVRPMIPLRPILVP